MQALIKNKLFLGIIALFIVAMFAYRLISSPVAPVTSGESALSIGEDLLELSTKLSRADLSRDLFTLPGYVYLTDFSLPVPPQSFGRTNPFDIIGRD